MNINLSSFRFSQSRQEVKRLGKSWVIDDSYNSNPVSFRSAIKTLDSMDFQGKKVVVCADMLELGKRSQELHRACGKLIAKTSIDCVLSFGREAKHITQQIKKGNKGIIAIHSSSMMELQKQLKHCLSEKSIFLVKGSRSMKMERAVNILTTSK